MLSRESRLVFVIIIVIIIITFLLRIGFTHMLVWHLLLTSKQNNFRLIAFSQRKTPSNYIEQKIVFNFPQCLHMNPILDSLCSNCFAYRNTQTDHIFWTTKYELYKWSYELTVTILFQITDITKHIAFRTTRFEMIKETMTKTGRTMKTYYGKCLDENNN